VRGRLFEYPALQRDSPWWNVVSLIVHVIIVVVLVRVAGPTFLRGDAEQTRFISLIPAGTEGPRQFAMPVYGGVPEGGSGGGRTGSGMGILPTPRIDTMLPPPGPAFLVSGEFGPPEPGPIDTSRFIPGPLGYRLVGPRYADGRVWVRSTEAGLGVVGPSPDTRTHVARIDSAIRERVKAYIDTMPRDSFALPAPPRWTTEIGGNTWGMDGSWIYLGDFKIPTALLALLPLPQGNYERAQDAANLQRMREEIIDAARRAETASDFRRYVEEVRKRRDAEREREKARRDTVIP
jgi:hypothetical protein